MGRPHDRVARGLALALVVGLATLTGCAKIEARDLIREGNALYNDAQYVEAIDKYDAAEELEPDGVTLYWNRACAAESQVLKMKDPKEREARREFADQALKDFKTWRDRLETQTEEEATQADEQLLNHRLAILNADERCDDLLEYWLGKHRDAPKEEGLYKVIARQYDECGDEANEDAWYVKRTEDFPNSVKAWHELAIRRFDPLFPDPESGLPFNEEIPPAKRLEMADEVIRLLDKATSNDPKFRDAYVWRAMAYAQRQHSRLVIEEPELPEEKLEAILAREDAMDSWRQTKAVCDLEELPDCPPPPKVPEGSCCPQPPLSPAEQAEDAALKQQVNDEMKAAAEAARLAAEEAEQAKNGKGKRKRRKKKKGK